MKDKRQIFIEKARKVHGNKYDYSKVVYIDSLTKVCIICPEHGEFWQTPQNHIRGRECPLCANKKRGRLDRFTKDQFIEKAKEIHGDDYDYSQVEYINMNTKVCIICKKHGEFWQTPLAHIYSKQGCPKCAGRGLNTEEIIAMFKEVHGDDYDYSKVVYEKMHSKVCIICPFHGEFWQTPSKHLLGQGCRLCGNKKRADNQVLTTEQFIEKAIKVHGDTYIYKDTVYKGAHEKVDIICKYHGKFSQIANDHLTGHGCPLCNESHLETEIKQFLIENDIDFIEQYRQEWLGTQSLDYYLPKYNIAIECQGKQHFAPIEHFGGKEEYDKIIERDNRKRTLCNENNIKILYYSNLNIEYPYEVINDKELLLNEIKKSV